MWAIKIYLLRFEKKRAKEEIEQLSDLGGCTLARAT
jgi:hypothetical protein